MHAMAWALKVLHTADLHLDPKFAYLGAQVMERRKDFLNALHHVVECALERRPHFLLISGDFFDSVNPRNPARTQVIRALRRLHLEGVRVFMIAGNHDMPRSVEEGLSPLSEIEASGYARFFSAVDRFDAEQVRVDGVDVAVAGMSFNPSVPAEENPLRRLKAKPPVEGDVNLALLHYNFAGVKAAPMWRAPTLSPEDVPRGCRYLAMGHVHSRALKELGETVIAYPGSTERRTFLEESDSKGFLWAEIPLEGKPRVEFVEVPTRPMRSVKVEVSPDADPVERVLSSLPPPNSELLLRVVVTGTLPLSKLTGYSKAELLKRLEGRFFHAVVEDEGLRCSLPESTHRVEARSPIEAFRKELEARMHSSQLADRAILAKALEVGVKALEEAGAW